MNLTASVTNIFVNAGEDNGFDVDEVELGISRLWCKVDDLYMRLGMIHFAEELGIENSQVAMESVAAEPLYRFNPMRFQGQNCSINTPTEGDVYFVFGRPRWVEEKGEARPANGTEARARVAW